MTVRDRLHWDERYSAEGPASDGAVGPPASFATHERLFPTRGRALDLACGRGRTAVWLAVRGLTVCGVDVSPVAVRFARDLAERNGVADRCGFDVVDLDTGLPAGPPVDLIVCHRFREPSLYGAMIERLAPGGLLAVAVLSEVGQGPGPFRAAAGELRAAFGALAIIAEGEGGGEAWLLART
ncbi:MAG: class I SAM-dependent methyltransferase [Acidimicrobiales bacterium]